MFFAAVLYAVFGVGVVAALVGLFFGVRAKVRDRRTPEERWADENGDRTTMKVANGAQTGFFGTGL